MNSECLNISNTWGCVHPDVIQWYINESQEINKMNERIVKGLAFLHIPPPEYFYGTIVYIIILIFYFFYFNYMNRYLK